MPVVDQTGLTGHYDYDIKWDDELKWGDAGQWYYATTNGLKQAFLDQLGLELVPGRAPVEFLVVAKKCSNKKFCPIFTFGGLFSYGR